MSPDREGEERGNRLFLPEGGEERNHLTKPEIYSFMDNLEGEKISACAAALLRQSRQRRWKPNLLVSNLLQLEPPPPPLCLAVWQGGRRVFTPLPLFFIGEEAKKILDDIHQQFKVYADNFFLHDTLKS